jgi:hypothetical protein
MSAAIRHCAICGVDTSPPDEDMLVAYAAENPLDTISEDDVSWVRRFRILGHRLQNQGTETEEEGEEKEEEEEEHRYFLSGKCVQRGFRVQFYRGEVADVDFNNITSKRGDGPDELLSMSWPQSINHNWMNNWMIIHEQCYQIILRVTANSHLKTDKLYSILKAGLTELKTYHLQSNDEIVVSLPIHGIF